MHFVTILNFVFTKEIDFQRRLQELLGMPSCEPSASQAAKDYRERYEELTGCSLWECPVCHQGRMLVIEILPRSPHRKTAIMDMS